MNKSKFMKKNDSINKSDSINKLNSINKLDFMNRSESFSKIESKIMKKDKLDDKKWNDNIDRMEKRNELTIDDLASITQEGNQLLSLKRMNENSMDSNGSKSMDFMDETEQEIEKRLEQKKSYGKKSAKEIYNIMEFLKKFGVDKGDPRGLTHGCMGLIKFIHLPIEKEGYLLKACYETMFPKDGPGVEPQDFCIAPCLTRPLFMWFEDLDFKSYNPIPEKIILSTSRCILEAIKTFFPQFNDQPLLDGNNRWNPKTQEYEIGDGKNRYRLLICTSGEKQSADDHGKIKYGMGVHIYTLGRLRVTEEQALIIRQLAIRICKQKIGHREEEKGDNTWEDVFDKSVYQGNGGMRSPYCFKAISCSDCVLLSSLPKRKSTNNLNNNNYNNGGNNGFQFSNRSKFKTNFNNNGNYNGNYSNDIQKSCMTCSGTRKVLVKQYYSPLCVIGYDGKLDKRMDSFIQDKLKVLLASSIRTAVNLTNLPKGDEWKWNDSLGVYDDWVASLNDNEIKKKTTKQNTNSGKPKIVENGVAGVREFFSRNSKEMELCLMVLENSFNGIYKDLIPDGLERTSKTIYRLNIELSPDKKSPSRYCLACQKHHINRNYFLFTTKNIIQKSYSSDCDPKKAAKAPISNEILEILFGTDFMQKRTTSISLNDIFPCEGNPFSGSMDSNHSTSLTSSTSPIIQGNVNPQISSIPEPFQLNTTLINSSMDESKKQMSSNNYFGFFKSIRDSYIKAHSPDVQRSKTLDKQLSKYRSKKQKTNNPKQTSTTATYVPDIYINEAGTEVTTNSNIIINNRPQIQSNKNSKPTIQWNQGN